MIALGGIFASACYSGAHSQDGGGTGAAGESGGLSSGVADDSTGDGPQAGCEAPPRRMSLLTNRRYGHAVRDLLGLAAAPTPTNGGGTHSDLVPVGPEQVNSALVFEYHDIAEAAADEALAQLDVLAPCAAGTDELECAGTFIDELGARAFRRPLTAEERDGLLAVWQVGREQDGDYAGGVRLVVVALLQSPTFLYVAELGEADDDGTYRLTPWEVATQLSFFLLDSIPDAELRAAAEDGRLATDEGVAEQVDRLVASDDARASITGIVLRWIDSEHVLEVDKQAPEFTPELKQSMQRETELFVDDLLWQGDRSLDTLLTSPETFVDAGLAELYGVEAPAGEEFARVTLPGDQRMGVLTHASLLASRSGVDDTSVVHRGLFVARDLLCMSFPPPPPGAAEADLDAAVGQRARAEHRMSTAPCNGCHPNFDPFGLVFEHYDELGRYRTTIGDVPVDASWDIPQPPSLAGPVESLADLVPKLVASAEIGKCATQRVTTYAVQRQIDLELSCHVDELAMGFAEDGRDLVALVKRVATSQVMRIRSEAEGP